LCGPQDLNDAARLRIHGDLDVTTVVKGDLPVYGLEVPAHSPSCRAGH
jgi:hypothetical protein